MSERPEIPGFDVMELIGTGGFARVYRAVQSDFHREVAIKVLRVDGRDDEVRHAFERECALTGRLTGHPFVLTVLGSGYVADDVEPYLVLEYCPGGTLSKGLSGQGPLPVADVLSLGVSLAGALHSAHRHGIIHRDVKPQNVLYTRAGVPVLTDFGVAKLRTPNSASVTGTGLTPLHAAPEVLLHQPASPASDLYSLGSTLYSALSGHAPFGRSTDAPYLVMQRAVNDALPPLERRDIPDVLHDLIVAVTEKDPRDRPTLPEFAAELRRCAQRRSATVPDFVVLEPPANFDPDLTTDSVSGADLTPSSAAISLQRTRRRRRNNRGLISIGAVAILLAAVLSTWALTRQSDDELLAQVGPTPAPSTMIDVAALPHLPDGPQSNPPPSYPAGVKIRTTYQDRTAQVGELATLLQLPTTPTISDIPEGSGILRALPVVNAWAATNPGSSAGRCHQMLTEPLLLEAAGEVTAVESTRPRGARISITAFHDTGMATEYYNVAAAYMGISDAECASAPERSTGLVAASGPPIEHRDLDVSVPQASGGRYDELNVWKGIKSLRNADLNTLPVQSGYTAVGLIGKTVIVVTAGAASTSDVDAGKLDQILLIAASIARV